MPLANSLLLTPYAPGGRVSRRVLFLSTAVAALVSVGALLENSTAVQAVDPPYVPPAPPGYVAWDDNLIPQQLGAINAGDPAPYVVGGRFYDVGRVPNPTTPPATTHGDWRFRVTHIKFDWKENGPTGFDEAQTMMHHRGANLAHVEDGKTKGEWIYKYATFDSDAGRSEPALYLTSKRSKIHVRIECADPVKYAYVGAKELLAPYPAGGTPSAATWIDVKKTPVPFKETAPGSGIWVSYRNVQVGSDADGNPIYQQSNYVELELDGRIKATVDRSEIVWQWYVDRVNSTDELAEAKTANEFTASVKNHGSKDGWAINKSGEYATQEIVIDDEGNTQEVEIVLPHRFYTILERSKYPWYDTSDQSNLESAAGTRKPWATALDFSIIESGRIELRGFTTLPAVAERVSVFCYRDYGLHYDHNKGKASFVYTGSPTLSFLSTMSGLFEFQFQLWLIMPNTYVNCDDQALALATLTALVGGDTSCVRLTPFGYVKASNFVGDTEPDGDDCNNPFFKNTGVYAFDANVGDDDTCWNDSGLPALLLDRSMFAYHTWMEFDGRVYDATAGEPGSDSPRILDGRDDFKSAAIDLSQTALAPWKDNEEMACSSYQEDGRPLTPAQEAGGTAPDPNYKNGDMTKAVQRAFTLN